MSGRPVVRFQNVSKRYRLAGGSGPSWHLREALAARAGAVLRRRSAADRREEVWSVRDIDLEINRGEVVGIVGRNGAGKSTLLKLMTRITFPTNGVVMTRGAVGALLEVGTGFHPELTGRENVYLNGAILGMSRRTTRSRFDEIVEFAGVSRFMDVPVKRYSSGMFLRLAFSVAAHLDAEILAVDEVLAVGDAEFQRKCIGKIRGLSEEGRTVLFVSHDLAAVRSLCTRACWLDKGRLRGEGTPGEMIDSYLATVGAGASAVVDLDVGNATGRVVGARILGIGGELRSAFGPDERIALELEVEVKEEIPAASLSCQVMNERGVLVLDEDSADTLGRLTLSPGRYRGRVEIPPVLNVGDYTVGFWFGSPYETVAMVESVAAFRVEGGHLGRGDRTVRLGLPWRVEIAGGSGGE